jgi:hypothetical protein
MMNDPPVLHGDEWFGHEVTSKRVYVVGRKPA